MTKLPERRLLRRPSSVSVLAILFAAGMFAVMFAALATPCFADDGPKPDPSGIATGDKTTAVDAAGKSFVVSEPTDKAAPDYATNKKAFDDYQAQAAKEPLAVKLADSVGHVRVATNFAWTLNTGYLVLFMQAGFALLTCGLVRKKNAAHLDDAEFRGLRLRLSRLLRRRICLPVWSGRHQCRAHQFGRHPRSTSFCLAAGSGDSWVGKDFSCWSGL
jgi:hypothetical protein